MDKFLFKPEWSDVQLKFLDDPDPIPAHGVLLAAASPVLAQMLSETSGFAVPLITDGVTISDTSKSTFCKILSWIYGADWDPEKESITDLLSVIIAAQIYIIDPLEKKCSKVLITRFNDIGPSEKISILTTLEVRAYRWNFRLSLNFVPFTAA